MEAILRAAKRGRIRAEPAVVVSNKADAAGLATARRMGVATEVVPDDGFAGDRAGYDALLVAALRRHGVNKTGGLVCLAGFMRVVGPGFVRAYKNRLINIHPSLLPAFPGLHAQRQAVEHGVRYSGCTVHMVDEGVDTGPIVAQAAVRVVDGDAEESLSRRILAQEHRIYPEAVGLFADGRIRVVGGAKGGKAGRRRVVITGIGGAGTTGGNDG